MKNKIVNFILIFGMLLFNSAAFSADYSYNATECYNQGLNQFQAKSYYSAISSFQKAIQFEPNFADAYYNLAVVYETLNQYEKAIDAYSHVLKISPKDYDSIYQLANIYFKKRNYTMALKYLADIPQNSGKIVVVNKLKNDCQYALKVQQERINRERANTANSSDKIILGKFPAPTGLAVDSKGNTYIACYADNSIMKIGSDKKSTIFIKNQMINGPIGLAIDKFDNIYVANYTGNNVVKILQNGKIFIFMNKVSRPYYLYIKNDILYLSEQSNNTVIKYNL